MANETNASVADAAQDLSEQSLDLIGETGSWIANNGPEILMGAGVAAVIALVLLGLRAFGHRLIADQTPDQKWRMVFGRVLAKTSLFFILMVAATLVVDNSETPALLTRVVNFLFVVSAAFQAAVWARELILGLVYQRVGAADESGTLGSAIGIIRLLVTVALFAIAVILILDNLGVNVTGLVAGLGIGGIAIGLAAQGIFSDLFAALSIIFDKPFRRGDGIRFDTTTGTVEHIGLKTTRIRSLDGQEVVISNTNLLNKEVHNFANLEHRRILLKLAIVYQTPLERLERIPAIVREVVEAQPKAEMIRCGMIGLGQSSLDYEVHFDVHSPDFELVFETRNTILLGILAAFAEAGIAFAYPTQTTFTAAPDGRMVMPYAEPLPGKA